MQGQVPIRAARDITPLAYSDVAGVCPNHSYCGGSMVTRPYRCWVLSWYLVRSALLTNAFLPARLYAVYLPTTTSSGTAIALQLQHTRHSVTQQTQCAGSRSEHWQARSPVQSPMAEVLITWLPCRVCVRLLPVHCSVVQSQERARSLVHTPLSSIASAARHSCMKHVHPPRLCLPSVATSSP